MNSKISIYFTEYNSAIKNELLIYATTKIDLQKYAKRKEKANPEGRCSIIQYI